LDFWLLAGRLARRWYLTLPLAVGAVALAVAVSSSVRPSYSAETQVLLAPQRPVDGVTNPLLLASQSQLAAATQSVVLVLSSPTSAAERQADAPGAEVGFSVIEEAPIIVVSVDGDRRDAVEAASDVAVRQVESALRGIEDPLGATAGERIDTVQLAAPAVVEEMGDRRRVLIGVLVGALLAEALVVLALDQALRRRLERRLTADLDREVGQLTNGTVGGPRHHVG
jgi:hypothetical protein